MFLCPSYASKEPWTDLLEDCHVDAHVISNEALFVLEEHMDEVWFLQVPMHACT
jgi:hypothetical protein